MISKINTSKFVKFFVPPIIILHLLLLYKTTFTLWPEMTVYPYLLNKDFLIYKDIINPYPPIFIIFLAQFGKIFGYNPNPYFLFTILIILSIDLIVFYISARITKNYSQALLSLIFFILFSIPFGINGLWFDLIQTPLILFAFYHYLYFLKDKNANNLLFSMSLVTIAIFIKQQAIWLMFWFALVLVLKFKTKIFAFLNSFIKVTALILFIFLLHLIFLKNIGVLKDFLFWTIYFPFFNAASMPGYVLFPKFRQLLVIASLFVLFIPAISLKKNNTNLIILTAIFLIIFAYPRFDYFHLIPALAIFSIAVGPTLEQYAKKMFFLKLLTLVAIFYLAIFFFRYYSNNWQHSVRFFEPEILSAANFLSKIAPENGPTYIQNGPDQLLPLSGRIPIKPWADEFPWYLEVHGQQSKIVESLKRESPRFLIYKPYIQGARYELGAYMPEEISSYIDTNYQSSIQISENLWLKTKK